MSNSCAINIEQSTPPIDTVVLLWTEDDSEWVFGKRVMSSQWKRGEHYVSWQQLSGDSGFNPVNAVTHWMPLPEAPTV